jgi:hypothetical protein
MRTNKLLKFSILVSMLFPFLSLYAQQAYLWRVSNTATVTGNTGFYNTQGLAATYANLVWSTTGTLASCIVQIDYSNDGSTVAGQLIPAQTCTIGGAITAGSTSTPNYVRISYVIGSGGGFIKFTGQGCINNTCTTGGGGGGGQAITGPGGTCTTNPPSPHTGIVCTGVSSSTMQLDDSDGSVGVGFSTSDGSGLSVGDGAELFDASGDLVTINNGARQVIAQDSNTDNITLNGGAQTISQSVNNGGNITISTTGATITDQAGDIISLNSTTQILELQDSNGDFIDLNGNTGEIDESSGSGVVNGSPNGGAQGGGTYNAQAIYINGNVVAPASGSFTNGHFVTSHTGGTPAVTVFEDGGFSPVQITPYTSSSIGGSLLAAGACASGTATATGITNGMVVDVTPQTYPGDGIVWKGYMSAANTVTVKVCAIIAATPTASLYNVRVIN